MNKILQVLLVDFFILCLFVNHIFSRKSDGFFEIHEINVNKLSLEPIVQTDLR